MLKNAKGNIVKAVPLSEIEEFIYKGYPSEEDLKILYNNNFVLDKIVNDEYFFTNKSILDSPFVVRIK